MGLSLLQSNILITISLLITVLIIPFMGYTSDKIGRRPIIATGAIGFVIFSYPILWLIATGLVIYGIILAPVAAVVSTALSEMFPLEVRCTVSAIGYNGALVLFGGTTPIVAQLLVRFTHDIYSPCWYISIIAFIHLLFVLFSKETKDQDVNV